MNSVIPPEHKCINHDLKTSVHSLILLICLSKRSRVFLPPLPITLNSSCFTLIKNQFYLRPTYFKITFSVLRDLITASPEQPKIVFKAWNILEWGRYKWTSRDWTAILERGVGVRGEGGGRGGYSRDPVIRHFCFVRESWCTEKAFCESWLKCTPWKENCKTPWLRIVSTLILNKINR